MKHRGCNMEWSEERIDNIMQLYDMYVNNCKYIRVDEASRFISCAPAKRFYVSAERASKVMYYLCKGDMSILEKMWPLRREMFETIYMRLLELKQQFPTKSVYDLCITIVEEPAPKFYLKAEFIERIISQNRKRWYETKRQKSHRSL